MYSQFMMHGQKNVKVASSCLSVCGPTQLSLDGFLWNFVFEYFPNIWWENWSFIKIRQEYRAVYM